MTQPIPRIRRAEPSSPKNRPQRLNVSRWAAAAPALLTLIIVLLLGIAGWAQRPDTIEARYRRDAETDMAAKDFATARICYERLLQHSPTDPSLLLGLAKSLQGLGQPSDAIQILQRIAPAEAPGYSPAQVYVAEQILSASTDARSLQLAETHARRALEADPRNDEARLLLERIYANTGRSPGSVR